MPRIRQCNDRYAVEDFRKEIRVKQGYYDLMTVVALAEAAGMPRTTLSKRLNDPDTMTVEEVRKLVSTIHPDPLVVLALLGYSKKDLRKLLADTGAAVGESA